MRLAIAAVLLILTPAVQAQESAIEYPSVAAALTALKAKPGVEMGGQEGWTFIRDGGVNWSFTPSSHYAHPSVGKRELRQHQGRFYVETRILCEASKQACDRLHADYQLLDKRMNEALQRELQKRN